MVPLTVAQVEQPQLPQPVSQLPQLLQLLQLLQFETQQLLQRLKPRHANRGAQARRDVQQVLQLLQPVVAQVLQPELIDAQPQSETGVASHGAQLVVAQVVGQQLVVGQQDVTQRVTQGRAQQRRRSN